MTSDRFVTVAWVYDAGELGLLLSFLEWEEIPVVPIGYYHGSMWWNWTVALGGVRLRVREVDAPAALALLASLERTPQTSVHVFPGGRLVELLLILLIFLLLVVPPPARIQAEFAVARRERRLSPG